jgi:transcriptional regulator with XRE-family HTH domain
MSTNRFQCLTVPLSKGFAASGMSVSQFARVTGLHSTTVEAVLKGDHAQKLEYYVRVAAALGREIVIVPQSRLPEALSLQVAPQLATKLSADAADLRLGHIANGIFARREQEGVSLDEACVAMSASQPTISRMFEGDLNAKSGLRLASVERAASLFNLSLAAVPQDSVFVLTNTAILEWGISTYMLDVLRFERALGRAKRGGGPVEIPPNPMRKANVTDIVEPIAFPVAAQQPLLGREIISRRLDKLRSRLSAGTDAAVPATAVQVTNVKALGFNDPLSAFYQRLEPLAVRMDNKDDALFLTTLCTGRVNATISKVFEPIWRGGLTVDMSVELAANHVMKTSISSMDELAYFLHALTETANLRMLAGALKVPTSALKATVDAPANQAIEPLFRLMQRFGVDVTVSKQDFTMDAEAVKMVSGGKI